MSKPNNSHVSIGFSWIFFPSWAVTCSASPGPPHTRTRKSLNDVTQWAGCRRSIVKQEEDHSECIKGLRMWLCFGFVFSSIVVWSGHALLFAFYYFFLLLFCMKFDAVASLLRGKERLHEPLWLPQTQMFGRGSSGGPTFFYFDQYCVKTHLCRI